MYNIIKGDEIIATVDKLQFWKMQKNGIRINCSEREANGIYMGDTFYHLQWMPHSGAGELDVIYEEFSGVDIISEMQASLTEIEEALNG